MNLNQNPSVDDLKRLLSVCDDNAGSHIIWVGHDGNVHIDLLPSPFTPGGWAEAHEDEIKFRLETCDQGNSYVGPDALDSNWPETLFEWLSNCWKRDVSGYWDYDPG